MRAADALARGLARARAIEAHRWTADKQLDALAVWSREEVLLVAEFLAGGPRPEGIDPEGWTRLLELARNRLEVTDGR